MRSHGNNDRRHEDQTNSQLAKRPQIRAKISPRDPQRRRIKQWRKKQKKDQVRLQSNPRQTWNETHQQAADDKKDWVSDPYFAGQNSQSGNRDQQSKDDFYGLVLIQLCSGSQFALGQDRFFRSSSCWLSNRLRRAVIVHDKP